MAVERGRWLREPGDSNCSFLSAAAPSLPFFAFFPLSGVSLSAVQGSWEGEGKKSMVLAVLVYLFCFRASPVFSPSFPISFPLFLPSHSSFLCFKTSFPFPSLSFKNFPPLLVFQPSLSFQKLLPSFQSPSFLSKQPSLFQKIPPPLIQLLRAVFIGEGGAGKASLRMGSRARGGWLASGRGALSFGEQHAVIVSCLKGRGALSFGSSRREEEQCQDDNVQFLYIYIYIYLWG